MSARRNWRWSLDPRDPDYADPPDRVDDDIDPPDDFDDPAWLGPPDYEGTAGNPR